MGHPRLNIESTLGRSKTLQGLQLAWCPRQRPQQSIQRAKWIGNVVELVVFDLCHGFWNIVNRHTFAKNICGICLYRLKCIDMNHFFLFVMYGMGSGHTDEAITSWWYQQNVLRAEFDNNDVPCPHVVFSDNARNYKIPFNKRRRGIPKDAALALVYGGYGETPNSPTGKESRQTTQELGWPGMLGSCTYSWRTGTLRHLRHTCALVSGQSSLILGFHAF